MSSITKVLVAGLATFGAVSALPNYPSVVASTLSTVVATPAPTPAPADPAEAKALFADLFTAPTAIKRFQRLLTDAGNALLDAETLKKFVVFDFNDAKPAVSGDKVAKGGAVKAANIETFPILTGLGISTTVAFLGPCGMNTPHVHPRATEFLTVVDGTVKFGYILENGLVKTGSSEVSGELAKFQGTVFPQGSIHYQFNPTCKPATFVAALNSEDPGTSQVAQNFFGLNPEVVNSTLGFPKTIDGKNIADFRASLPLNLALAIDECVATCYD